MNSKHYDFIVIGGGSGGIASARRAAQYGASVLLIEGARLGGTCVNVGCVPKKVMWNASQIAETLEIAGHYGFNIEAPTEFQWPKLKTARDAYVARLNDIYSNNLAKSQVDVIEGFAHFTDAKQIRVNGHSYSAAHILVATGGKPVIPNIDGADYGIDSDGFFDLETQPKAPLIIGAGYIAVELAGLLQGLGSDVTMALRKDILLRGFDHSISELVTQNMQQMGIEIHTEVGMKGIIKAGEHYAYINKDDAQIGQYDCVIWAVGRSTNIAPLQLDHAGIAVNDKGFILVDEYQNTNIDGIYAVGDVTPNAPLTPVAIAAGRQLSDRLFGAKPDAKLDYSTIPTVVFSHPPIGTVGLSEHQAREQYGDQHINVYQSRFINMKYAVSEHKPATLVKLIVAGEGQKIVGCHVVGDGADEMMQGFAVAVKMGASKQDFDNTIAIHPTAAEEMVTLR